MEFIECPNHSYKLSYLSLFQPHEATQMLGKPPILSLLDSNASNLNVQQYFLPVFTILLNRYPNKDAVVIISASEIRRVEYPEQPELTGGTLLKPIA